MSDFIGYESDELQRLPSTRSPRESEGRSKNSSASDVIYLGSFRRIPKLVFLDDSDTDVTKNDVIFTQEVDTTRQSYVRIAQKKKMANKEQKNKKKNASSRRRRISNVAPV